MLMYPYNLLSDIFGWPEPDEEHIKIIENNMETVLICLRSLISELIDSDKIVLEKRYNEYKTLTETGRDIGKSKERVRQIEARAVRKLKSQNRINYLRTLFSIFDYPEAIQISMLAYFNDMEKKELPASKILDAISDKTSVRMELLTSNRFIQMLFEIPSATEALFNHLADFAIDDDYNDMKLSIDISELGLSARTEKVFEIAGCYTLGACIEKINSGEAPEMRNYGIKSHNEIINKIDELGFGYMLDPDQRVYVRKN